ncbi:MAG: cytochrome P450 [Spirochaetaceae bacterium]|nr:cytochrome P450 [Myxococcales bacterium]MCB9726270.1 cytochrome P450 [Spirochaetaceae bacterium]
MSSPRTPQPVDEAFAFDPTDPRQAKDFERMAKIRREKPVCRPAPNVVLTTRYEDTARVFRDSKRFSSVGDMRAPGVVVPTEESFLGELDAPLHPKIRRVLLKGFTRSQAAAVGPWTRGEVKRRLAGLVSRGGGDLMNEFSIPLPGSISAHSLGIPDALHDRVMALCDELLHSTWPTTGRTERGEGIAGSFPELAGLIDEQIRLREGGGGDAPDDLLGLMVRFRDEEGWEIGAHHNRTLVVNILAGSLSASYMLGNLIYRLLTDAGFERALRADPANCLRAVDESMRLEAPVAFLMRTAREDTEIGGVPVYAGEHIMCHIASANRDELVYDDADSFRLDRVDPPEHLGFGIGPHICLGNHLTRQVGTIALEELLAVLDGHRIELAPDFEWECVNHLQEYGPEHLPVSITKRG